MAVAFMQNVAGRVPPSILAAVSEHLKLVEQYLHEATASDVNTVSLVGRSTLEAGGKRLRPALVSVAGHATGLEADPKRLAYLGACLEMIHMASLVHDDVIDGSEVRRGKPTAMAMVGNHTAILSGDVLLAKSMQMLATDGDLGVIRETSDAVVRTIEGQVAEIETRDDFDLSLARHIDIIEGKTAALLATCCRVGAMAVGADPEVIEALGIFGLNVGMAFQVVDDLLDYRGDNRKTGKTIATDFRGGCATWPLISLRSRLDEAHLAPFRAAFGTPSSETVLPQLLDAMQTTGVFSEVADQARAHVATAKSALDRLPKTTHRHLLDAVADFVIERDL